uniref:Retrotransposon protein n=1 Tax=Tanacetum cinerariifolium TaxID=118510 RepID=A0A6L2ME83_TANCI|nr:retrotransposon protein [Tanacetum cinerariifolium]
MSTQQDIYVVGSENRHAILSKDNYVPWSSHLFRYAKNKPNEKLLVKSILKRLCQYRMMEEPGDLNLYLMYHNLFTYRLMMNSLQQKKRNRVGQKANQNLGIQNVKNKNGLIVVLGIGNQNRNGNVVAVRAEGNGNGNNPNRIRCYNYRGMGHMLGTTQVDLEPDEWIKDSGYSKHMVGNQKLFSTYKAYNGSNVIFGSSLCGKTPYELLRGRKSTLDYFKVFRNDDLDDDEAIRVIEKKDLENDIEDKTLEIDKVVNIKESRNHPLENVIGNPNKKTLRNKLDENGIVSQNKARLIAQRYNQQEGLDYDETYAPVVGL